jgi:hypothetical protein
MLSYPPVTRGRAGRADMGGGPRPDERLTGPRAQAVRRTRLGLPRVNAQTITHRRLLAGAARSW